MNDLEPQNRRRSQRVLLQVAVVIILEAKEGNLVRSQGFTQVVNAHGGLMDLPFRMMAGQKVLLENPKSGQQAGCRIVRVGEWADGSYPTAFEFDECNPHFWPISFPPVDWTVPQEVL